MLKTSSPKLIGTHNSDSPPPQITAISVLSGYSTFNSNCLQKGSIGTNQTPSFDMGAGEKVVGWLFIRICILSVCAACSPTAQDIIRQAVNISFIIVCFSPDVVSRI